MKTTALIETHRRLGARLVEFAGYEMPVQYGGILAEHRAVRERCGLFDVSHMGRLQVEGREAMPALQRLATNDLSKLKDGGVQYNHFCNESGGVLDDLLVYRLSADRWAIVCNASNRPKIWSWLTSHLPAGVLAVDETDQTAMIAAQGPRAKEALQPRVTCDLSDLKYYRCLPCAYGGTPVLISRTGYTGEDGYEVTLPAALASRLWDELCAAGASPCGLGARDTLRLEASMPLYGHELSETRNPLHAGLDWVVKLEKGEFIGREAIRSSLERGLSEKLCGFEVQEKGAIPRQGYAVFAGGAPAGEVTSGVLSPTLGRNIGMAYVRAELARPGGSFEVEVRGRRVAAQVVAMPFYKRAA